MFLFYGRKYKFVWVMTLIVIGARMVGNFNEVRKPEKRKGRSQDGII